jgi:hypothetical protein
LDSQGGLGSNDDDDDDDDDDLFMALRPKRRNVTHTEH